MTHFRRSLLRWKNLCIALAALSMGVFPGCDNGRPKRVKVAGHVRIDGQPLEQGYVSFFPTTGRPGGGQLGEGGAYSVTMYETDDGLPPGKYAVSISGTEIISDESQRWHAPKKYADPTSSGFKVEIDQPTDSMDFELTWQGENPGEPFVERW